jgi:YHS domain-containing protein
MLARRLVALLALAALLSACGSMNVVSEGPDTRLMLKGYDPVSYFVQGGRPTPGRPDLKAEHEGVTYRFMSEETRKHFVANPARFVPQYGGFCANGMVYAIPNGGEPENYKIINGKLYVFGGARSKLYFEMEEERNLKLADGYWQSEVKSSNWRLQSWNRVFLNKVPHYKTNAQLAAEYEQRTGKKL